MHITREFNSNEKSLSEKMNEIITIQINEMTCNSFETELKSDKLGKEALLLIKHGKERR